MNCFHSAREPHLPSRVRHGKPIPLNSENKVQAEASAQSDYQIFDRTPGPEDLSTEVFCGAQT
jgi:hypothetical protein